MYQKSVISTYVMEPVLNHCAPVLLIKSILPLRKITHWNIECIIVLEIISFKWSLLIFVFV